MADKSERRGLSTPGVTSRVDTNELYPLTFQVVNVAAAPTTTARPQVKETGRT